MKPDKIPKLDCPTTISKRTRIGHFRGFAKAASVLALTAVTTPLFGNNLGAVKMASSNQTGKVSSFSNHSPVAKTDIISLERSSTAFNVLANDSDPDGDRLLIVDATAGFGAVVFTPEGLLGYAQNPGKPRADKITYTVSDGFGGFDTGVVEVFVG